MNTARQGTVLWKGSWDILPFLFILCTTAFTTTFTATTFAQSPQSYRLIETVNLPQKLGFRYPPTRNLGAIALDDRQGKAFIATSESAQFPVVELDSIRHAGFVQSPLPLSGEKPGLLANPEQKLLYFYTANSQHDTLKTLFAVHTPTQKVVASASYKYGIWDIALERASNRLFIADNNLIRIFNASTLQTEDSIYVSFNIGGIALDSTHKRFFVASRDVQLNLMRLAIYSLAKPYNLEKVLLVPMPTALPKMFIDTNWNRMLLVGNTNARVLQLGTNVTVKHISFGGFYEYAMYSLKREQLLVANKDGYGGQGEGGSYGKLLAIGSVKDTRDSMRLGMHISGIALDESRDMLAAVAAQQESVQFYQLSTLKPLQEKSAVDFAYSFDDLTVSSDGTTAYIANRFGAKPRLLTYTFAEQSLADVPVGAWTTALAVDSARGRLFALAQQENLIYLFSTITKSFLGKVPIFGYKELRSDALASISLDKIRQKLYVCMPEHKTVASVDLSSAATDRAIKVLGYHFSDEEALNGGLQTLYIPESNKLCVLRTAQQALNIYNLTNNTLADSINLANKWTTPMQLWQDRILSYDAPNNRVFVGSIGISMEKNHTDGRNLAGSSCFLGYNAKQTSLFGISKSETAISLHEYNPQTLAPLATRLLYPSNEKHSPLTYFDSKRNQLLILERESGMMRRYDINTLMSAPIAKQDTALTTLSIFPNPVVNQATVRFGVRKREKVKLTVLDSQGREVAILTEADYEPGTHTITLKVESDAYSSQTYFVQLKSPSMYYSKPIQVQRQ
jgi:DNA-binding beta-propeller fold protein YncE